MNDFTKEELFDLKYAIEKMRQPAKDSLGFYKLRDKIQSMIDNYKCNHNWNFMNESGFVVCDWCNKVATDE